MTRRTLLARAGLTMLGASTAAAASTVEFFARRRNADGGYGWSPGELSHITPTFAAVGCHVLLGEKVPGAAEVAEFARSRYPVPDARRTDRPLWRFDFEQAQTLAWLGQPVDSLRPLAETWTKPAEFTKRYELYENPVFQHQAMAVCARRLAGIDQSGAAADEWRAYFARRRRPNSTYNNTPWRDGEDGHVVNTVWGVWAAEALGQKAEVSWELARWVENCQTTSGGFTYAPGSPLGGIDDVMYTWAALWLLNRSGRGPRRREQCVRWLEGLAGEDGGFHDRSGGLSNPTATYYALECFRLLKTAAPPSRAASAAPAGRFPMGSRVFTIQIEAPGAGSPADAVLLAEKLGIHIWTAKNSAPGWIDEAQRVADARKAAVRFAVGDEEYGTYVSVPGLGTYSHLVDLVAPAGRNFGAPAERKEFGYPWPEFRDSRIRRLRAPGGRLIWQFNENEELTRALLDEAMTEGRSFAAISSFHFGRENFLETQPFLQRWIGRLPMVGLQDAHGAEPWWWGDWLAAFRTLFIAREPTWEGWLTALDRNHVAAVRRDTVTGDRLQMAGATPEVREFLMARQDQWCWWGKDGAARERPAASLAVLRPGSRFEAGAPPEGVAVRLRLWADNTGQGVPRAPRSELVSLEIDGRAVVPREVSRPNDRYLICAAPARSREVVARVRALGSGKETLLRAGLE